MTMVSLFMVSFGVTEADSFDGPRSFENPDVRDVSFLSSVINKIVSFINVINTIYASYNGTLSRY